MKKFYVIALCLGLVALTATISLNSAKAGGECNPSNFMGTSFMC